VTVLSPRLELIVRDATGSQGAILLNLQPATTVAEADTFLSGGVSAFLALTGCTLVATRLVYKVEVDIPSPAADGSTIKRTGVFVFDCADDTHQTLVAVPGILDSVLVTTEPGAGVLIDTELADVGDFLTELFSVPITDPFANDIASLVAAYRQSRV